MYNIIMLLTLITFAFITALICGLSLGDDKHNKKKKVTIFTVEKIQNTNGHKSYRTQNPSTQVFKYHTQFLPEKRT